MSQVAFVCAAVISLMASVTNAADFVRISVTGTNVNLRPQPHAGGEVLSQTNPNDEFIAETTTYKDFSDGSEWYKILFSLDSSGNFRSAARNSRFKGSLPYISARFVSVASISSDDEKRVTSLLEEDKETYILDSKGKKTKVYRVKPGGKRVEIKDPDVGASDGFSWVSVGRGWDGTDGSQHGVYFFNNKDEPLWFLSVDMTPYGVSVSFAPDKKHVIIRILGEAYSSIGLYAFGDAKEKASFETVGSPFWMDANRFAFTLVESDMGWMPDWDDGPSEEFHGWSSVAVCDTGGKLTRLIAATETKSYSFDDDDADREKKEFLVNEASVKSRSDWSYRDRIVSSKSTIPFPDN